jgi:teichuronic acid exporter
VQKKEVNENDANTVFYINLILSLILYGVFWFTAPIIANFYEKPQLILLTRIMAIVLIINAFKIIQIAQLTRYLDFRRKTKATLLASPLSGLIGISAAYYGMGVWSLVMQQLSNQFIILLSLWGTSKWRPRLQFSFISLKLMFAFGGWLLLSGLTSRILNNIYVLTIGKFLPAAQLGYYTKGKSFSTLAIQELSQAITTVTFPVFSKIQDNKSKLATSMLKIIKTDMLFTVPIMVTLLVTAKPFVITLLTDKWLPMVPYLQLFCIIGMIYPVSAINRQVLKAQGKSRLNFNIGLLIGGLSLLNIFIMYRWGLIFIIIGQVILSFISLTINTYYTKKLINVGLLRHLSETKEIMLGAIISGIISYILTSDLENLWLQLCFGGIISIGLYIISQYFFNRKFVFEILELRKMLFKN